jgi:hypothetical protein
MMFVAKRRISNWQGNDSQGDVGESVKTEFIDENFIELIP